MVTKSDIKHIEKEIQKPFDYTLWSGLSMYLTTSQEGRNLLTRLNAKALHNVMATTNEAY